MELPMKPQLRQTLSTIPAVRTCMHGRLIDYVLTKRGERTGQVRCLECGMTFDDPYLTR